jgi:hypothetical protein
MGLTNVLCDEVRRRGTRAEARSAGRPSRRRGRM